MQNIGLMLCGAVLFVNALMLLGRVDNKSAGIFNLFIGSIQVITPFYVSITSNDQWIIFNASGVFLFGLTFLYVGISNLKGYNTAGIGWFSLWVTVLAIAYGTMSFIHFNDIKFGIIWFMWAFLWFLFFFLMALNKEIAIFTGWVTLIESVITTTIPAFLLLIGKWNIVSNTIAIIVTFIFIVVVIWLYFWTRLTHNYKSSEIKIASM
ncbi:AmiS/UreI family transporter [Metabacillus fastidiosus]|uniref:AmiS/UreI family transporter n=1 Tax=Metabacillus fastidiosus TaxID=1458 RepID=UPI003D26BD4C